MDLFNGALPEDKRERNKNPMIGPFDTGLPEAKCKSCKYLLRVSTPSRRMFSKCELRGVTRGKGTDHSMYYDACLEYKERD